MPRCQRSLQPGEREGEPSATKDPAGEREGEPSATKDPAGEREGDTPRKERLSRGAQGDPPQEELDAGVTTGAMPRTSDNGIGGRTLGWVVTHV